MRTRSDPVRAEVVSRRLELLRAEIARDWSEAEAAPVAQDVPEPVAAGGSRWDGGTRVAARVPAAVREPVPALPAKPVPSASPSVSPSDVPAVPVPGRHAARRASPAGVVPEQLRGRVALGPWQLAVVAIGVAAALAITCWWLVRGSATPAPAPAPALTAASAAPLVSLSPAAAAAGMSPSASAGTGTVTVDVEGKVRRPGVAVLSSGARVIDAIRAAGGAPRRRDLSALNLAAVLVDGQQLIVGPGRPAAAGASTAVPSGGAASPGGPGAPVDLNTATAEQLDALPGVGPVTAQSILEWRDQNGRFSAVEDLLSVSGIGPATLAKIAPFVTV